MWYWVLILLAAVAVVMMLRVRVRFELAAGRRRLFLGLGRSGADLDLARKSGRVRLFGLGVRSFSLARREPEVREEPRVEKRKPKKRGRERSLRDAVRLFPRVAGAFWSYVVGLLRAVTVEEADGEIRAGFDAPDLTGMTFGWYEAALAAVPSVMSRMRFVPDWTGPSLSGALRLSVAIPLYSLLWHSLVLILSLPLRKVIKLAIGEKKGVQDG
ncbi:MAG TPA: hypothetical protein VMY05_07205 [Acidobacteriota bacterium]|nr:hypothetical protein [Acidobacteriota bacterium]